MIYIIIIIIIIIIIVLYIIVIIIIIIIVIAIYIIFSYLLNYAGYKPLHAPLLKCSQMTLWTLSLFVSTVMFTSWEHG